MSPMIRVTSFSQQGHRRGKHRSGKEAEVILLPLDGQSILPLKINNSITGTLSFFARCSMVSNDGAFLPRWDNHREFLFRNGAH